MRPALSSGILLPIALTAALAACAGDPVKEGFMLEIRGLKEAVERIENDNRTMWGDILERAGAEPYIVVDTEGNKLHLRQGDRVLLEAKVSTGSGKMLEEKGGRKWIFNTPKGEFRVLGKEKDPLWYKPDWAYVEDNLPIPPPDSSERVVKGMLGRHALGIGGSYKIHGTPFRKFLGQSVSHGCIRLADEDMEKLYNISKIGTKVYIY